jgi:hypothetical protein
MAAAKSEDMETFFKPCLTGDAMAEGLSPTANPETERRGDENVWGA